MQLSVNLAVRLVLHVEILHSLFQYDDELSYKLDSLWVKAVGGRDIDPRFYRCKHLLESFKFVAIHLPRLLLDPIGYHVVLQLSC